MKSIFLMAALDKKSIRLLTILLPLSLFGTNIFSQDQPIKPIAELVKDYSDKKIPFYNVALFTNYNDRILMDSIEQIVSFSTLVQIDIDSLKSVCQKKHSAISLSFPYDNKNYIVDLVRVNILTEDFSVITNKNQTIAYSPGIYYRGIIRGNNKSLAAFSFFNNEIMGVVSDSLKGNIVIGKLKTQQNYTDYIIYSDRNFRVNPPFTCSTVDTPLSPVDLNSNINQRPTTIKCVGMYYEVDFNLYQANNNSITNTVNWMTAVHNNVSTLYSNDNVTVGLREIYVWTSPDPYVGTTSQAQLTLFQQTRTSFNGDVGQLIGIDPGNLGGRAATINGLCNSALKYAYSDVDYSFQSIPSFSWTIYVITHEFGHLLGSRHTHACVWNGNNTAIDGCGPVYGANNNPPVTYEGFCSGAPIPSNGGTIMSYCHLGSVGINFTSGFGPQPSALIRNIVDNASCLGTSCSPPCLVCPSYNFSYTPTTSWQTHSSNITANGCKMYRFSVTGGNTYTFKTGCGDGATASYDTYLTLYNSSCTSLLTDDDGCENGRSTITYMPTSSGDVYLKVSGFGTSSGTYTLAYRYVAACTQPAAPTLTFGTSSCPGAVGTNIFPPGTTLSWNPVSGATGYKVYVSKYPYGSSCLLSGYNPFPCQNLPNQLVLSAALEPGMLYRWNMNATSNCSNSSCDGPISGTNYFYVPPSISPSSSQTICQGNGVSFSTTAANVCSGGTVTYQWYRNGLPISGATSTFYNATLSGTYYVQFNFSGSSSCSSASIQSSFVSVTVNPLPTVSCPSNSSVCSNAAPFTLTGGLPAGGTYSGSGVSGGVFNPSTAGVGVKTITYSYTNPNTGCTNSCSFTITVNALPTLTCPANSFVCITAPAFTLTGGSPAGGTYSGPGVSGGQFNPAAGVGTHTITYMFTNTATGCTNSCTFTITVNALPTVTCPANSSVCIAAPAFTLTGGSPAGGTYSGTGVSGGQFNPTAAGLGPHTITYNYTNPSTGCSNSCTFTISVISPPTVICPANSTVCLNAAAFILTGGLPAGGIYSGPGVSGGQFNPSSAGVGTHTITYNFSAPGCSPGSCSFTITVSPLPIVTCPANSTVCINAASFALTGGSPAGGTYSGPGVSGGQFNPATAGTGVKTITYSYTNPNTNCTNNCTFNITVNPLPTITCPANSIVCINAAPFILTGGLPAGGTYSGSGVSGGMFNPAVAGNGSKTITYTYINPQTGCTNSCTFIITVNALPTVACPASSSVCITAPVLTLTGGSPAGGSYSGTGVSAGQFNAAAAGLGSHTITYNYTNPNTGCSNSCSFVITVIQNIISGTLSGTSPLCIGGTTTFTSNGTAGGTWSSSNTSVATVNASTGVVTAVDTGRTTIVYTITACNSSPLNASHTLTVEKCIEYFRIVPNPNNGVFTINFRLNNNKEVAFKLYTTNGQIVFQSTDNYPSGVNNKIMTMSKLPRGIYFLEIKTGEKSFTQRVVIIK